MTTSGLRETGGGRRQPQSFLRRWTAFTVAGEFAGFAVPGLSGALLAAAGAPDLVFSP